MWIINFSVPALIKSDCFTRRAITDCGNVPSLAMNKTYDNEEIVRKMVAQQNDMRIPAELIPEMSGLRCADDHEFTQ